MQRKAYGSLTKIFMCPARKQTKPKHGGICLRPHGNRPLLPSRAICRFQSVSRGFCTRGGSGATVSPFRRNAITVPAQRYHRSGATAPPFRRNGTPVPAQRGGRSRSLHDKPRRTAKAPLTFRHSLRTPRLYPLVGAAVPCRPSRPQPKGRGGSPLPPASPLPPGRGGSPLPPVAPPPRPRSGLSKKGVRPYS